LKERVTLNPEKKRATSRNLLDHKDEKQKNPHRSRTLKRKKGGACPPQEKRKRAWEERGRVEKKTPPHGGKNFRRGPAMWPSSKGGGGKKVEDREIRENYYSKKGGRGLDKQRRSRIQREKHP